MFNKTLILILINAIFLSEVEAATCWKAVKRLVLGPSSREIALARPYLATEFRDSDPRRVEQAVDYAAVQVEAEIKNRMMHPSAVGYIGLAVGAGLTQMPAQSEGFQSSTYFLSAGLTDVMKPMGYMPLYLLGLGSIADGRLGRTALPSLVGAVGGVSFGAGASGFSGMKTYALTGALVGMPVAAYNFVRETRYRFKLLAKAKAETAERMAKKSK